MSNNEENKAAEPQKPTGKRPSGLVASSKEDRGPWLGLAELAWRRGRLVYRD